MTKARGILLMLLLTGLGLSTIEIVGGFSIVPAVQASKCTPHYTVAMSPTSASVQRGNNVTFQTIVQGVCKLPTIALQFFRSITPQVTNGPTLPPPICYHGCNIVALFQGTTLVITSVIGTSTNTPTGAYTFTMLVDPDSCPIGVLDCTSFATSVSATLTVT